MRGGLRYTRLIALLVVPGCATNALRIEYAGNVSAAGTAAAARARDLLVRTDASRLEARAELVAADPACASDPIVLRADPVFGARAPARGGLCREGGVTAGPSDRVLRLDPVQRQIAPTLALMKALTLYTDALGEIAGATPADPAQSLVDAHATAFAAADALRALAGGKDQPIPGPNDPRIKAIAGFVRLLGELVAQAHTVDRLRARVAAEPDGVATIVPILREQLLAWNTARATASGVALGASASLLRGAVAPGATATPRERRDAVMLFYARQTSEEQAAALYPALENVLAALEASDTDFRRVLVKDPTLSAKERARVLEIGRKRLVRALQLVTDLSTAFAGA